MSITSSEPARAEGERGCLVFGRGLGAAGTVGVDARHGDGPPLRGLLKFLRGGRLACRRRRPGARPGCRHASDRLRSGRVRRGVGGVGRRRRRCPPPRCASPCRSGTVKGGGPKTIDSTSLRTARSIRECVGVRLCGCMRL